MSQRGIGFSVVVALLFLPAAVLFARGGGHGGGHGGHHGGHHSSHHHSHHHSHAHHGDHHHWGHHVHHNWNHHHHGWAHHGWWGGNHWPGGYGWWNYGNAWAGRPWNYGWGVPAWDGLANWFGNGGDYEPIEYNYDDDGNVAYDDDDGHVYVNDEDAGTQEDYAKSAEELASVPAPKNAAEVDKSEWMPLGTFAVATSEDEKEEPTKMIQLAVNKEGIISGIHYNEKTDRTIPITGRVDRETQRVAFGLQGHKQPIFECGLYNLTQDEAPLLAHFGPKKTENFLLVRTEPAKEGEDADEDKAAANQKPKANADSDDDYKAEDEANSDDSPAAEKTGA